ncbi:MAG TPA: NAD(P)/FAD-dependent oxidoreductase [Verrucomicrobiae bacterium]|nr:NAD(P)/FAD-dependent oxidoreductase [Verrucomicrobiae bacterium]
MSAPRVIVVGGGAAGFFAAIACAEANPSAQIQILEKSANFLGKVRISGGGRCNVTHACFDAVELTTRFPRGERALRAPFQTFQARDTVEWFQSRGVRLKTENDGRMFPVTDSSQTIIDCLTRAATAARVKLRANSSVAKITKQPEGQFEVTLADGESIACDKVLLATGGCRAAAAGELAVSLGHTLRTPVPSLFTFHIQSAWVRELSGVSVATAVASVPGTKLREQGALLFTHWGLSGPVILRLSAWGARVLHDLNYQFPLRINWLPQLDVEQILNARRHEHPNRFITNTPIAPLSARLWEKLVLAAGIPAETRWAALPRAAQHTLTQQLVRTELQVTGKSLNKDEFVTCGGVRQDEVDFKTMESRVCPGLYFAGELLDIDGITGGFNFQAAWTTGWLAGRAMATSQISAG